MSKSNILFIMTGSIACYKACQVVSKLAQKGHEVQVVATASALKFIGNATIEGLTGRPVVSDLFEAGNVMDHIHLARWADLILVAPATAHFMNKMASGIGDDLASTLFLAHDFKKPFLLAPAMNTMMYQHPTTQESLKKLTAMGVQILESASGILACGETGYGRLLEPEQILEIVEKDLPVSRRTEEQDLKVRQPSKARAAKVLVTAGGTQEPIDDVRVLSNISSGQTGYQIAMNLMMAGFEVELLRSANAQIPKSSEFPQYEFTDYKSLDEKLKTLLGSGSFTHVIHAAAVSDYSVSEILYDNQKADTRGKLDSSREITVKLSRNPKLISLLKSYSPDTNLKIIGFKLTSRLSPEAASAKVERVLKDADFVVHNDLQDIDKAAKRHKFTLWGFTEPKTFENVEQLSVGLMQALSTEVQL